MITDNSILQLFPSERRFFWEKTVGTDMLQEIRLRVSRPVIVIAGGQEFFVSERGDLQKNVSGSHRAGTEEIEKLLNHICHYSLYAYEDEIRQGYLTVPGGHRVGLAGQVVLEADGSIRTIKNISYLNIRIARQIKGAADEVLPFLYKKGRVKNLLLISPPGCGKTTLLRDLIRQISDGNAYGEGCSVGVVDERSELAGSCEGIPQNDMGLRTDVLDACSKSKGMMLLLRSMTPGMIAIDELGSEEEMQAVRMASYCGVGVLATVHGEGLQDVAERFQWKNLLREGIFDLFLVLGKKDGKPIIREIIEKEGNSLFLQGQSHVPSESREENKEDWNAAAFGRNNDNDRLSGVGNVVPPAIYSEIKKSENSAGHSGNVNE